MTAKNLGVQSLSLARFVVFEKKTTNRQVKERSTNKSRGYVLHRRMGMMSTDGTGYHRYRGFNQFSKRKSPIPRTEDGWKNVFDPNQADWVTEGVFDPTAQIFQKRHHKQDTALTGAWKTINNGNIQYLVVVSGKSVSVYGRTRDIVLDKDLGELDTFVDLVKEYTVLHSFIGISEFNEMTEDSGGYGEQYDGNSVLIRIGNQEEFRYAFIGHELFEFTTREPIKKYVSSISNSGVPCPYAESDHWCYDMLERTKSRVELHPDREQKGEIFTDHVRDVVQLDDYIVIDRRKNYERTPISPTEKMRVWSLTGFKP